MQSTGILYSELDNVFIKPRIQEMCLTAGDVCNFNFQTFIFSLYKINRDQAKMAWKWLRLYFTSAQKIEYDSLAFFIV